MDEVNEPISTRTPVEPEAQVEELVLAEHLDGYWPSSKNVSQ